MQLQTVSKMITKDAQKHEQSVNNCTKGAQSVLTKV